MSVPKRPIRITFKVTPEENEIIFGEAIETKETLSSTIRNLITDGLRYREMIRAIMRKSKSVAGISPHKEKGQR